MKDILLDQGFGLAAKDETALIYQHQGPMSNTLRQKLFEVVITTSSCIQT